MLRALAARPPQTATDLLLKAAVAEELPVNARVLELCTGSGRVATEIAQSRPVHVTAVDLRRGDLFDPVAGERFDLILTNPPYVPGSTRRDLVDRICAGVADHLSESGVLLIVQPGLSLPRQTVQDLQRRGLSAGVVERALIPFVGPDQDMEELVVVRAQRVPHPDPVTALVPQPGTPNAREVLDAA